MTKCTDALYCRNLVCAITFLVIGITLLITGGVLAAVGFGTWPKDMFDKKNLSMRVIGLIMVGSGILPLIMGILFIFFYCGNKSGKFPGRKKPTNDFEVSGITKGRLPADEYPYPSGGGPLIYKPGPPANYSLMKFEDSGNNDSFTVPLSERSFNNGRIQESNVYSDVKESEEDGFVTKTTTTTTKVYKTTTLENKTASESSSGGQNSTEMVQIKPKRPKKHPADASGSGSSEVPSFNESDVIHKQKARHVKKNKKKESFDEEVFDDGEEPLPDGRNRSAGSDTVDGQHFLKKSQNTTTTSSYEVKPNTSSDPVYGKVNNKRRNMI